MKIIKNQNAVWIKDVPILFYECLKDNTVLGAIELALSGTNKKFDYIDLIAFSTWGGRIRWFHGNQVESYWNGDSIPGSFEQELIILSKLTGLTFCSVLEDFGLKDQHKKRIIESINVGVPVICVDKGNNLAVIYGYESDGKSLFVRSYIDPVAREENWDATIKIDFDDLKPFLVFIEMENEKRDYSDVVLEMFKTMVSENVSDILKLDNYFASGIYYSGTKAIDKWIKDLESTMSYSIEQQKQLSYFTWWNLLCLSNARFAFVRFLRNIASSPIKNDLEKKIVDLALIYMKEVRLINEINNRCPWKENYSYELWISEVEIKDIVILRKIKKLEHDALMKICAIIDIMNKKKGELFINHDFTK